jgi:hypothetical protein
MMMIGQLLLHALINADQFCLFWPPELVYIHSYIYIYIYPYLYTQISYIHTHTSPNKHITSNLHDHDREFGVQSRKPNSETFASNMCKMLQAPVSAFS